MPFNSSDPKREVLFDRREKKTIGYFIDLVEAQAKQAAGASGRIDDHIQAAMRELQKEHSLYD